MKTTKTLMRIKSYVSIIWKAWGRELIVVLFVMIPFRSSIADWNHVPTGSMKPTILECERVFVNKLAYDLKVPLTTWHLAEWAAPRRGDIVVFNSPADGKRLVKRVVGLPGDVVAMRDNQLMINGQAADYGPLDGRWTTDLPANEQTWGRFANERLDGLDHPVMAMPLLPAKRSFAPLNVPPNHYLMLGDNRDNSADSRYFGFVERHAIVGKVTAVVASFDPNSCYLPRIDRWLMSLP